jgi:hypothetical protein
VCLHDDGLGAAVEYVRDYLNVMESVLDEVEKRFLT